ncbi:MAG: hypothetical protein U0531_20655 [Dehalococcoidia bacterium]
MAPAEVVVLATPWDAAEAALPLGRDLAGKVLIDCTNPLGPGLTLTLGHTTSGAEAVAGWAAGARVVRPTTPRATTTSPRRASSTGRRCSSAAMTRRPGRRGGAHRTPGVRGGRLRPLATARLLEPAALLWIWLALAVVGRDFAFGLLRRDDA